MISFDVTASDVAKVYVDKFIAFTKPFIRSIYREDLSAELPFDLSEDENQVIAYFQRSTMTIGRSGTGKTTCLIFKLVAHYLARRKAQGRPKRQVNN